MLKLYNTDISTVEFSDIQSQVLRDHCEREISRNHETNFSMFPRKKKCYTTIGYRIHSYSD